MPRPRGLSIASDRISARRSELKKTRQEMAEKAGIGVSTWANLENGHQDRASVETLSRIARSLGLHLDQVVAPQGRPEPIPRPPVPPKPEPTRPPNKPDSSPKTPTA